MIVSYAQNGEDVVLERLFAGQFFGRYIDVGAANPTYDSVTKNFYERGWRGVNIEPDPRMFARFPEERPGDVNLNIAVSDRVGELMLYTGSEEQQGLATLDIGIAEPTFGTARVEIAVKAMTLTAVWEQHIDGPVDLLKIDVEGWEEAVIAGADWERFRPRVLVIEATLPNSTIPSHQTWEPMLIRAGYRCTLFDGLNRFYVEEGDLDARALLAAPANPHDEYRRYDLELARQRITQLEADLGQLTRYVSELEQRLRATESQRRDEDRTDDRVSRPTHQRQQWRAR